MADIFPYNDADFNAWQANFLAKALAHAAALNLSPADTAQALALQGAWAVSYPASEASRRQARTDAVQKNSDGNALKREIRKLHRRVMASPTLTDAIRTDLGAARRGRPEPGPLGQPNIIRVDTSDPMRHIIHWRDAAALRRRARPVGVAAAKVFIQIGGEAPVSTKEMRLESVTRSVSRQIQFGAEEVGKRIYYAIRWTSSLDDRAEDGPMSEIHSAIVTG